MIAKISQGHVFLREENINVDNNYNIKELEMSMINIFNKPCQYQTAKNVHMHELAPLKC
jgi:hypothetical protein